MHADAPPFAPTLLGSLYDYLIEVVVDEGMPM